MYRFVIFSPQGKKITLKKLRFVIFLFLVSSAAVIFSLLRLSSPFPRSPTLPFSRQDSRRISFFSRWIIRFSRREM